MCPHNVEGTTEIFLLIFFTVCMAIFFVHILYMNVVIRSIQRFLKLGYSRDFRQVVKDREVNNLAFGSYLFSKSHRTMVWDQL